MKKIFYLSFLLFSSVLLHAQVGAQGGHFLDLLYGNCDGGCATMTVAGGAVVKGMVWQPENLIANGGPVVCGYAENGATGKDFFVVRFGQFGSPSNTFDGDGRVFTDLGSTDDEAWGMAIQPDSKIILAGFSGSNFAVVKYNPDGDLDNSFNGTGKVITNLGGNDNGLCMALQADGKILVAGITDATGNGDFAVVRYNSNGTPDATFGGGDGIVTTGIGTNTFDVALSIKVQPDGKILVAGTTGNGVTSDIAVVRYNADGTLDTSFDGDGKLTTNVAAVDVASRVAVQFDGKIVVGGYTGTGAYPGTNRNFLLIRYSSTGVPDATFDGDGIVTTNFGGDEPAYAMTLQTDGKTILGGTNGNDFLLARYTSTGALDLDFHNDGWNTYNLGYGNPNDVAADMLISSYDDPAGFTVSTLYIAGNANTTVGLATADDGDARALVLPEGASLPLTLLSFSAQKQSSNIQLNWQTEREQNISGFDIQRSADGRSFKNLGYATPITTTGAIKKNYSYVDNTPLSAMNYYRLAIKDLDGSITYSRILAIKNNSASQQLEVFPNPLPVGSGSLQVQLPAGLRGRTSLQISDITGRIVRTMTFETGGNSLSTAVDVSTLTKGIYMVRVKSDNSVSLITKFLKN